MSPLTSSLFEGVIVPIPTKPAFVITVLETPLENSATSNVF